MIPEKHIDARAAATYLKCRGIVIGAAKVRALMEANVIRSAVIPSGKRELVKTTLSACEAWIESLYALHEIDCELRVWRQKETLDTGDERRTIEKLNGILADAGITTLAND